jgi:hypothetical protein
LDKIREVSAGFGFEHSLERPAEFGIKKGRGLLDLSLLSDD